MTTQGAQPRNDSFDVLTVFNPSETPFEVWYNSELQNVIQPGRAIPLVKLLAGDSNHGAIKHLVDRMCKLQGVSKNEPKNRAAWVAKILIKQDVNATPHLTTLEEQAKAINQQISQQEIIPQQPTTPIMQAAPKTNPDWKFDPLTGARIEKKPAGITPDQVDISHVQIQHTPTPAQVGVETQNPLPPSHPDPETNALLQGVRRTDDPDGRVLKVDDTPDEPAPALVANWPENPTHDELLKYATNVLMMDLTDEATKAKLDAMDVEALKTELRFDRYA